MNEYKLILEESKSPRLYIYIYILKTIVGRKYQKL
jgi:hypothetical protein